MYEENDNPKKENEDIEVTELQDSDLEEVSGGLQVIQGDGGSGTGCPCTNGSC